MEFSFPDLVNRTDKLPTASTSTEQKDSGSVATPRVPLTAFSTVTHAVSSKPKDEISSTSSDVHKVTSEKAGASQMDYLRLETKEDAGTSQGLRNGIPLSELRMHDKPGDAWISLKGKVYDMSSYLQVGWRVGGATGGVTGMVLITRQMYERSHPFSLSVQFIVRPLVRFSSTQVGRKSC